jgi:ribosomal protein S18 acetylase RimI-like enzyme
MPDINTFTIRSYIENDHPKVCSIFKNGLLNLNYPEGFDIEPYIEESLATDLKNIETVYMLEPGSHFWCAANDTDIAGIVAIKKITDEVAELRRMSVSDEFRHHGVATKLLKTAETFCVENNYSKIKLTTTNMQIPAVNLYKKFGFTKYGKEAYSLITAYHFQKLLADIPLDKSDRFSQT